MSKCENNHVKSLLVSRGIFAANVRVAHAAAPDQGGFQRRACIEGGERVWVRSPKQTQLAEKRWEKQRSILAHAEATNSAKTSVLSSKKFTSCITGLLSAGIDKRHISKHGVRFR